MDRGFQQIVEVYLAFIQILCRVVQILDIDEYCYSLILVDICHLLPPVVMTSYHVASMFVPIL